MAHRVLVAHHNFHFGGETQLVNNVIRALCDSGFDIPLVVSATKPSGRALEFFSNTCVRGIYYMFPVSTKMFFVYQRLLLGQAVKRALGPDTSSIDVVFIDNPFYKGLGRVAPSIVEYVHFPLEALLPENYSVLPSHLKREIEPYFRKYKKGFPWRMYLRLYNTLAKRRLRDSPFQEASLVLANSTWTNSILRALYGEEGVVLHPPIDYVYISRFRSVDRENYVVSIGRISPEKRFEDLIKAISLLDERDRPGVRIVGSYTPSNRWYLERLILTARRLRVDLDIKLNPPYSELLRLVGRSLVYVHAAIGEHFGITVVEAMALGLPVIVHRSGGAYYDVIDRDSYGLSYESIEELASHIDMLLEDRGLYERYSRLASTRAREFDYMVFKNRLASLLGDV